MNRLSHLLPPGALTRLDQTSFLSECRAEKISRTELETFLVQHYLYAKHFTRYLCALLANLTNEDDRLQLTVNLFEEMGLGDVGSEPHSKIYRDMLKSFGLDPTAHRPLPETENLVRAMLGHCSSPQPIVGLAAICLGAEAIVPHVYTQILRGLRARGFAESDLRFFPLHIDGDDDHALTMMKIIERELERDASLRPVLDRVASEMIEYRARFFEAISRASVEAKEVTYAV